MDWELYKHDFQSHDGLRDIYVLQANLADWNLLIPLFRSCEHKFYFDGEPSSLPADFDSEFFDSGRGRLLSLFVEGVQANCHFFAESEIELDIDPRDITDGSKLSAVLNFIRDIGQTLRKDVLLTPENGWRHPVFRYNALADEVKYCDA